MVRSFCVCTTYCKTWKVRLRRYGFYESIFQQRGKYDYNSLFRLPEYFYKSTTVLQTWLREMVAASGFWKSLDKKTHNIQVSLEMSVWSWFGILPQVCIWSMTYFNDSHLDLWLEEETYFWKSLDKKTHNIQVSLEMSVWSWFGILPQVCLSYFNDSHLDLWLEEETYWILRFYCCS